MGEHAPHGRAHGIKRVAGSYVEEHLFLSKISFHIFGHLIALALSRFALALGIVVKKKLSGGQE